MPVTSDQAAASPPRTCSCAPEERIIPCPGKHAHSACRATVILKRLRETHNDMVFEVFPDERFTLQMALERIS